ncbi:MAG TPA: hypothetical protein VGG02_08110 [Chthoniobacterales bacterium]
MCIKVNGVEQSALVEIAAPGLPSYDVVRVVRGEWANRFAPGISQNRIECLGREAIDIIPDGWEAVSVSSPYPVRLFQQAGT